MCLSILNGYVVRFSGQLEDNFVVVALNKVSFVLQYIHIIIRGEELYRLAHNVF